MRLREMRAERSPRLMIIPMIDIMFFLLVFFMLSTLYMVEQRTFPVVLPQAVTGEPQMHRSLAVTVAADGRVFLDDEEVPLNLIGRRAAVELARRTDAPVVVLRADRRAEYGRVAAVLDELRAAGVSRVAVATEAKDK